MWIKSRCSLLALTLVLMNVLCARAQLRPEVTPPPAAPKPAQRTFINTNVNANKEQRLFIRPPRAGIGRRKPHR